MKLKHHIIAKIMFLALLALTAVFGIRLIWLPFHWAGMGLRRLSLSGSAGNLLAVVLFILIGMLPLLPALKRKWLTENWLLILAVGVLYYVLYYFVNPGLRSQLMQGEVGNLILSGSFWSVLLSWALISFLRNTDHLDSPKIFHMLKLFLVICVVYLLWKGIALGLYELTASLRTLKEQNTLPGLNLLPTQAMLVITYLLSLLEYCLDAAVLVLGAKFLEELEKDPYSEMCCESVNRLVHWCHRSLIAILLAHTALNLGRLFFADWLLTVNVTISIPLLSIATILGIICLSRLLNAGRQLKEDNDLFI